MTFNKKISIDGIGGHINTNPKKTYKTKVVKSLFTGKTYQSPKPKAMTPEEIFEQIDIDCCAIDWHYAEKQAIQAIKQYAREMCDKQKEDCIENMSDTLPIFSYREVKDTPYPKELQ